MHTTVEVVTTDTAVAALSAAIVVTLVCTSLSQHCHCHCCHNAVTCSFSLPQRCARFRCYSAVLVFAVTALCSFSLLQRCAHRCLTAVGFLLCRFSKSDQTVGRPQRNLSIGQPWLRIIHPPVENCQWQRFTMAALVKDMSSWAFRFVSVAFLRCLASLDSLCRSCCHAEPINNVSDYVNCLLNAPIWSTSSGC